MNELLNGLVSVEAQIVGSTASPEILIAAAVAGCVAQRLRSLFGWSATTAIAVIALRFIVVGPAAVIGISVGGDPWAGIGTDAPAPSPPPPGFVLDQPGASPPLPPGFERENPAPSRNPFDQFDEHPTVAVSGVRIAQNLGLSYAVAFGATLVWSMPIFWWRHRRKAPPGTPHRSRRWAAALRGWRDRRKAASAAISFPPAHIRRGIWRLWVVGLMIAGGLLCVAIINATQANCRFSRYTLMQQAKELEAAYKLNRGNQQELRRILSIALDATLGITPECEWIAGKVIGTTLLSVAALAVITAAAYQTAIWIWRGFRRT